MASGANSSWSLAAPPPREDELDLGPIKVREVVATMGPWQIVEDCYDETPTAGRMAGKVAQRRIFTTWDHPQLKGPLGVVNMYTSIVKIGGKEPPNHGVSLDADDAEFIAHARQDIPALVGEVERLRSALARLAAPSSQEPTP